MELGGFPSLLAFAYLYLPTGFWAKQSISASQVTKLVNTVAL